MAGGAGASLREQRGFELRREACWFLGRAGDGDPLLPPWLGTWQDLSNAWGTPFGGSLVSKGFPAHRLALEAKPGLWEPYFRGHMVRAKLGPARQVGMEASALCPCGLEVMQLRVHSDPWETEIHSF